MPTSAQTQPGSVLIVDDHPLIRRGLSALLGTETWVGDVLEAGTVRDGLRTAVEHRPALAIIDVHLPDGDGICLIEQLHRQVPGCRTLVVTMEADPNLARRALAAGAGGFLLKESDPILVIEALRSVGSGGIVIDAALDRDQVLGLTRRPASAPFDRLTERELELARRVSRGAGNAEIARALGVTEKTVRNQLSAVLVKVGVPDRVALALRARETGL